MKKRPPKRTSSALRPLKEPEMETFYTVHQAAQRLGVSPETVKRWLNSGALEGIRFGHRTWRIPKTLKRKEITNVTGDTTKDGAATISQSGRDKAGGAGDGRPL